MFYIDLKKKKTLSNYCKVMSKIDVKIFIDNLIIINEFCFQGPPQPGQPFKFTVIESCDRIKEEFNFLQAQYHR